MLSYSEINEKGKKNPQKTKPNNECGSAGVQLREREEAGVARAKPARLTVGGSEGRVVMGRSYRAQWAVVRTLVPSLSDVGATEGSEHWRDGM